jgi:hypothetical protein
MLLPNTVSVKQRELHNLVQLPPNLKETEMTEEANTEELAQSEAEGQTEAEVKKDSTIEVRVCTSGPIFVVDPEKPNGRGLKKTKGSVVHLPKKEANRLLKAGLVELVVEAEMFPERPAKKRRSR